MVYDGSFTTVHDLCGRMCFKNKRIIGGKVDGDLLFTEHDAEEVLSQLYIM